MLFVTSSFEFFARLVAVTIIFSPSHISMRACDKLSFLVFYICKTHIENFTSLSFLITLDKN
jgi:hypothetical protein